MKIPKSVIIGGRKWKVKQNPKVYGGYFMSSKALISVGTKDGKRHALHVFMHEVLEACMAEKMLRFQRPYCEPTNGDYIFVFNHEEFRQVADDVALALFGEG